MKTDRFPALFIAVAAFVAAGLFFSVPAAQAQGRDPQVQADIKKAGEYMNNNQWDKAIEVLQAAAARAANSWDLGDLHANLGWSFSHKNNYARAVEHYKKALGYSPGDLWVLEQLGTEYLVHLGDYAEGLKYYLKAESLFSQSADLYYNIACYYGKKGDADAAVAYLDRAFFFAYEVKAINQYLDLAEKDADFEPIRSKTAFKRLIAGRAKIIEAVGAFHDVSANPLRSAEEQIAISLKAEKIFREVLGGRSLWLSVTLNQLGMQYRRAEKFQDAETRYREALASSEAFPPRGKHSAYVQTLGNLGSLYYGLKRYNEAEPLLKKAAALEKETARNGEFDGLAVAYHKLGLLYYDMGRYRDAETALQDAYGYYAATGKAEYAMQVANLKDTLAKTRQAMGK